MTQPKRDTMPAPIDLPTLPPSIPSNAPAIAGSPWLTDPEHPDYTPAAPEVETSPDAA